MALSSLIFFFGGLAVSPVLGLWPRVVHKYWESNQIPVSLWHQAPYQTEVTIPVTFTAFKTKQSSKINKQTNKQKAFLVSAFKKLQCFVNIFWKMFMYKNQWTIVLLAQQSILFNFFLFLMFVISCMNKYRVYTMSTPFFSPCNFSCVPSHLLWFMASLIFTVMYLYNPRSSFGVVHMYIYLGLTPGVSYQGLSLEKIGSPSLSSQWLSVALHLMVGLCEISLPHCNISSCHAGLV